MYNNQEEIRQKFSSYLLKKGLNEIVGQGDLYSILDSMVLLLQTQCIQSFDRYLATSLFDQTKKNSVGKVHFNDFLDVLFKSEERLIKKLNDSTTRMVEIRKERDDLKQKMTKSIQYENINNEGFGEGILLTKVNSFHATKEISGFHEFSIFFTKKDFSYATTRKPFSNMIPIDEIVEMLKFL